MGCSCPTASKPPTAQIITCLRGAAAQVGPDDLARNALLQLLVQACKRDAFHTLRTVEQLGYMVCAHLLTAQL